ncbi:MAG: NMD3-related protein [Candidatus Woesearchaeota archaeon]
MRFKPKSYYEAVFQLRNPRREVLQYINKELKKQKVYVVCRNKCLEGVDFYLTSQHAAQNIGRKIYKKYGGELKITKKLFSKDKLTSKNIHRVTVYYRPYDFSTHDIIKLEGKIIKINFIKGNSVYGEDILSRKKVHLNIKNKNPEILNVVKAVISKTYPSLEVIHPITYQSVRVINPKKIPKKITKKEIKVVLVGDNVLVV